MLESLLAYAEFKLGPTWGPAAYELVTSLIFIVGSLSRRSSRRTQPMLHRAARDEQIAAMRHRIEVKAASLLHDTVLSQLAAIAGSVDNTLDQHLRSQVKSDLEILVGEEWLTEPEPQVDPALRQRWEGIPMSVGFIWASLSAGTRTNPLLLAA